MKVTSKTATTSNPLRSSLQNSKKGLDLKDVERILNFRLELLARVESLAHVSIAQVPYITAMGDMISLPGPWSIEVSSGAASAVSITASPSTVDENVEPVYDDDVEEVDLFEDDVDSMSDFGELQFSPGRGNDHAIREMRSISNATTNSAISTVDGNSLAASNISAPRFVVRNEFGHVRVQPMIEMLEALQERGRSEAHVAPVVTNPDIIRIGGHIVLPLADFASCIAAGLGEQHPFAGRYHPIAGNTIPETTLLFYGPRSEEELEAIWSLVRKSYEWVFSSCN